MADQARIDPTNLFDVPEADEPEGSAFEAIVGEGKKYRDPELLAKAALEKDRFIRQLEQENAALRGELQQRITLEEFADRVNSGRAKQDEPEAHVESDPADSGTQRINPEDIENRVLQRLQAEREKERRLQNAAAVKDTLLKKFGRDYLKTLADKAEELGVDDKFLTDMAQSQPKAFLALFDAVPAQRDVSFTPPRGVATERMPQPNTERTWQYYERLRKENPMQYYSPKVQNMMHKDAERLGDSFYT